MIDVYYWPTANGLKVGILLQELQLEHRLIPVNIRLGEQQAAHFRQINANGRIPVIQDPELVQAGAGQPPCLSESCAILDCLATRQGRFGGGALLVRQGLDPARYPRIQTWRHNIWARPAVQAAYAQGRALAPQERSLAFA